MQYRTQRLFILTYLVSLIASATAAEEGSVRYFQGNRTACAYFIINSDEVHTCATPESDLNSLAHEFCEEHSIGNANCALHVSLELSDAIYCSPESKGWEGVHDRKVFRFIHSPLHYDSEEFELLRDTFARYGYAECRPGTEFKTPTNFTWVLGHAMDNSRGHNMMLAATDSGEPFNTWIGTKEVGNKDLMMRNMVKHGGDLDFVPRTFFIDKMETGMLEDLRGLFVLKVPDVELGGGIFIIDADDPADMEKVRSCKLSDTSTYVDAAGIMWGEADKKGSCVLQKYVTPPLLLRPYAGSEEKKFSFGVYIHITLDPFRVFLHDEVRLCHSQSED